MAVSDETENAYLVLTHHQPSSREYRETKASVPGHMYKMLMLRMFTEPKTRRLLRREKQN